MNSNEAWDLVSFDLIKEFVTDAIESNRIQIEGDDILISFTHNPQFYDRQLQYLGKTEFEWKIHRNSTAVTLQRFVSTCQEIESDLRSVSAECRKKYPEVKSLVERGLLEISDHRDRREIAYRTRDISNDGISSIFPTWHLLSVVGAVGHISNGGICGGAGAKALFQALSMLQRLLALWQQQIQNNRQLKRISSIGFACPDPIGFEKDTFLTEGQLGVVLKILCEQSNVDPVFLAGSQRMVEAAAESPPLQRMSARRPSQRKLNTPEVEAIQLKILQMLLLLFSIDTPLLTFLPPNVSPSQSKASLRSSESHSSQTRSQGATVSLADVHTVQHSMLAIDKNVSAAIQSSACQARQLFSLLFALKETSPFDSVRHTASAGVLQFIRFIIDSSTICVVEAALSESSKYKTIQIEDVPLVTIAKCLFSELCSLSLLPSIDHGINLPCRILNIRTPISSSLSLELLNTALSSSTSLFSIHPAFNSLMTNQFEPMIIKNIECSTGSFKEHLNCLRLVQSYWTHFAEVRMFSGGPYKIFSSILNFAQPNDTAEGWRQILFLSFIRWLVERPQKLKDLFNASLFAEHQMASVVVKTMSQSHDDSNQSIFATSLPRNNLYSETIQVLGKSIHEICFATSLEDTKYLVGAISSDQLRFPSDLCFSTMKLNQEVFSKIIKDSTSLTLNQAMILENEATTVDEPRAPQTILHEVKQMSNVSKIDHYHMAESIQSTNDHLKSLSRPLVPLMSVSMSQWTAEAQRWRCKVNESNDNQNTPNLISSTATFLEMLTYDSSLLNAIGGENYDRKAPWSQRTITSFQLRLSIETLICLVSLLFKMYLLNSSQEIVIPFLFNPDQNVFDGELSDWCYPIALSPKGLLLYLPIQRPVTFEQHCLIEMVAVSWGSILAGLSLVLRSMGTNTGLSDLIVTSIYTLICLASILGNEACYYSCLHTLIKIANVTPSRRYEQKESSVLSLCCEDNSIQHLDTQSRWWTSWPSPLMLSSSHSVVGQVVTNESPNQIHLNSIQLLCWKSVICAAHHFANLLSSHAWKLLLTSFCSLHENLTNGRLCVSNYQLGTDAHMQLKSLFSAAFDLALMDNVASLHSAAFSKAATTTTTKNASPLPVARTAERAVEITEVTLLEASILSLFDNSLHLFLSRDKLIVALKELGHLMRRRPLSSIHRLNSMHQGRGSSFRFDSNSGCLATNLASVFGYVESDEKNCSDSRFNNHGVTFAIQQTITFSMKNHDRLRTITAASILSRSFLLGLQQHEVDDLKLSADRSSLLSLKEVICEQEVEVVSGFGQLLSQLVQHSTLSASDVNIKSIAILFSTMIDFIVLCQSLKAKQSILESFHLILRSYGNHIKGRMLWSLIGVFVGVITSQCFDVTTFSDNLGHEATLRPKANDSENKLTLMNPIEFGSEQSNLLFCFVDLLVRDFPDYVIQSDCLGVMVTTVGVLAESQQLGNNVSFTSVGLLWTLSEYLIKQLKVKKSEEDDDTSKNKVDEILLRDDGGPGSMSLEVYVSKYNVLLNISDWSNNSKETTINEELLVRIHLHLRHLSTDERVEVRNCSLRSLTLAQMNSASLSSNLTDLSDILGNILIDALMDVIKVYQRLLQTSQNGRHEVTGLVYVHHSRDSQLKLWDDSIRIILDGVLKSMGNFTSIHLIKKCGESVMSLCELILISPLSSKAQNVACVSVDGEAINDTKSSQILLTVYTTALRSLVSLMLSSHSETLEKNDVNHEGVQRSLYMSLWFRCWDILERASHTLWKETSLSDKVIELYATSINSLACTMFASKKKSAGQGISDSREEYCEMEMRDLMSREFVISLRILLIIGNTSSQSSRLGHPLHQTLPPPTPIPLFTDDEANSELLHDEQTPLKLLLERLRNDCAIEQNTWNSIKTLCQFQDMEFLNSNLFNATHAAEKVDLDVLLPTAEAWKIRDTQSAPTLSQAAAAGRGLLILFSPSNITETHKPSSSYHHFKNHPALSLPVVSDRQDIIFFPLFTSISSYDEDHRPPSGLSPPASPSSTPQRFDDDYFHCRPDYLNLFCYETPHSNLLPDWCPTPNTTHYFQLQRSLTTAMTIHRRYIPMKRLHSLETLYLESLEKLHWESLYVLHPTLWLRCICQMCEVLLDPTKIFAHTSYLLISARTINMLTRILRRSIVALYFHQLKKDTEIHLKRTLSDVFGITVHVLSRRIASLYTLNLNYFHDDMGYDNFLSEASLQILFDLNQLIQVLYCTNKDSIDPQSENDCLRVIWSAVAVGIQNLSQLCCDQINRGSFGKSSTAGTHFVSSSSITESFETHLLKLLRLFLISQNALHNIPQEIFRVLMQNLDHLNYIGNRHNLFELSQFSLQTMFDVCEQLHRCQLHHQLKESVDFLYQRINILLNRFIVDDLYSGQCPLPRQRLEELVFVLNRLRSLKLPISSFFSKEEINGSQKKIVRAAQLTENRTHLVLLLPRLVELISAKDGMVRTELRHLMKDLISDLFEIEVENSPIDHRENKDEKKNCPLRIFYDVESGNTYKFMIMANINDEAANTRKMREHQTRKLGQNLLPNYEETDLIMCSNVVNLNNSIALNSNTEFADLKTVMIANPENHSLVSDVDQQLILKINFKDPVTVTSVCFRAETPPSKPDQSLDVSNYSGPKTIRCFANNEDLDFVDTDSLIPAQTLLLNENQLNGDKVALKGNRFSRCHSVQFFIDENQKNSEFTFLNRLCLWGRITPAYQNDF